MWHWCGLLDTLHLTSQSGTVTLVPAITDVDKIEVPPAAIHYNAPTLVSRERFTEVLDFPI